MQQDLTAIQILSIALAGWLNRHKQDVIAYLLEGNRVSRDQFGREEIASQ